MSFSPLWFCTCAWFKCYRSHSLLLSLPLSSLCSSWLNDISDANLSILHNCSRFVSTTCKCVWEITFVFFFTPSPLWAIFLHPCYLLARFPLSFFLSHHTPVYTHLYFFFFSFHNYPTITVPASLVIESETHPSTVETTPEEAHRFVKLKYVYINMTKMCM